MCPTGYCQLRDILQAALGYFLLKDRYMDTRMSVNQRTEAEFPEPGTPSTPADHIAFREPQNLTQKTGWNHHAWARMYWFGFSVWKSPVS